MGVVVGHPNTQLSRPHALRSGRVGGDRASSDLFRPVDTVPTACDDGGVATARRASRPRARDFSGLIVAVFALV